MDHRDAKNSIKGLSHWPPMGGRSTPPLSIVDVSIRSKPGAGCRAHGSGRDDLWVLILIRDQTEADKTWTTHSLHLSKQFGSKIALGYVSVYFKVFVSPLQNQTFIASQHNYPHRFLRILWSRKGERHLGQPNSKRAFLSFTWAPQLLSVAEQMTVYTGASFLSKPLLEHGCQENQNRQPETFTLPGWLLWVRGSDLCSKCEWQLFTECRPMCWSAQPELMATNCRPSCVQQRQRVAVSFTLICLNGQPQHLPVQ